LSTEIREGELSYLPTYVKMVSLTYLGLPEQTQVKFVTGAIIYFNWIFLHWTHFLLWLVVKIFSTTRTLRILTSVMSMAPDTIPYFG
jgi:hypothetical protein